MRFFHTRLRACLWLTFVTCIITTVTLIINLQPRERVTRANFEKIELGMSQADLRLLLGRPQFEAVDLGMVREDTYLVYLPGGDPPDKEYRKYMRQQWHSPEVTIIAVFDTEGRVSCRYTGEGQRRINAVDIVWYWIWRLF